MSPAPERAPRKTAAKLGARISIVGPSGAGKTTLGRTLSAELGVPRLELDAVNHQANWTPIEPERFRAEVREFVAGPAWVTDGNYTGVGVLDLIWARAETVVWLDLPRWRTAGRVVRRSARRLVTREELWNGNRERLHNLLSPDRERNIVLWAWTNHAHKRAKLEQRARDPRWSALDIVRLRSPAEVARWLKRARAQPADAPHP